MIINRIDEWWLMRSVAYWWQITVPTWQPVSTLELNAHRIELSITASVYRTNWSLMVHAVPFWSLMIDFQSILPRTSMASMVINGGVWPKIAVHYVLPVIGNRILPSQGWKQYRRPEISSLSPNRRHSSPFNGHLSFIRLSFPPWVTNTAIKTIVPHHGRKWCRYLNR